jgi:inhibitor of cysteine peptidase
MKKLFAFVGALTLIVGLGVLPRAPQATTAGATGAVGQGLSAWFGSGTPRFPSDGSPFLSLFTKSGDRSPARESVDATPVAVEPKEPEVVIREGDAGRRIALRQRQVLVIDLEVIPGTGYRWRPRDIDEEVLRQIGQTTFEPTSDLPGAPARQVMRFEVLKPASRALILDYRRFWQHATPARTFTIQVAGKGAFSDVADRPADPCAPQPEVFEPIEPVEVGGAASAEAEAASGLPSAFNWCDERGCTPIADQGPDCGSCWAFATTGVMESVIKVADNTTRDLSEQYLISCNQANLNVGGWPYSCSGGWFAFEYFVDAVPNGEPEAGSVYEDDFPYTGRDDPCNPAHEHHEKGTAWDLVSGWENVPSVSELKQAVYDHGPIGVQVCANSAFQDYNGTGVFEPVRQCSTINHALVLVGWDDSLGTNGAWRVKNSWGTWWGDDGYMWIGYGVNRLGYNATYVDYGEVTHNCDPADVDCDGDVDTADLDAVVARWRCRDGDPCYDDPDLNCDVDQDGHVTVIDIELVAAAIP